MGDDIDLNDTEDRNDTEKQIRPVGDGERVIHPYGFVAEDWHWMIEIAVYNSVIPALVWLAFELWDKDR